MLTEQELSRKPLRIDALLIKSDDVCQMISLFVRIFQKEIKNIDYRKKLYHEYNI